MFPGSKLQTIYLAGDEFIEYTSYKEFRNDFEVKNITDEQYKSLKVLFADKFGAFGHTHIFDTIECFGRLPYE